MLCKPSVSSRTRTILVPSWNKCADEVFCPAEEKSHEHTESNLHDPYAIFSAEVDQQLKASAKSQHLVRKSKCGLGELEADHGQLGGSARFVLLGKLENLKSM